MNTKSKRAVKTVRAHMGTTLRDLRVKAQLSQEALGKTAGYSGKFVGELERGDKAPTTDTLWRLLRALAKHGVSAMPGQMFPPFVNGGR